MKSRKLYIMRHATAVPHGEMDPPARLLHPKGKREAKSVGRWLRDCGYKIDVVIASPFVRTKKTAKLVAKRVKADVKLTPWLMPPEPGPFQPEKVWAEVERLAGDAESVLIVAHGPVVKLLRDFLTGDPAAITCISRHWAYAAVSHIEDGKEHWFVTPKLLAKTLGFEDWMEVDDDEQPVEQAEAAVRLAENLMRGKKRELTRPLNAALEASLRKRFRQQKKAVLAALRTDASVFGEAEKKPLPPATRAAIQAALAGAVGLAAYNRTTAKAYSAGRSYSEGALDGKAGSLAGFGRKSTELEGELDATTFSRLETALETALGAQGTLQDALTAAAEVFTSRIEQDTPTIASNEVSDAFHSGQGDAARSIAADSGDDLVKQWECEDDACDDCLDCEDEGEVDVDFTYPAFGVDDPPGHPNCRCSLTYKRASENAG